ncbi:chemotaxis protein CheW [Myxococcota bacterium]|nr:chemotaxis protein CheW [Myxococcota bacterium]
MSQPGREQMLVFEIAEDVFALPVADVVEVLDAEALRSIPSVPRTVAGVIPHHGDVLPVVERSILFERDELRPCEPHGGRQFLVVGDRRNSVSCLGFAVDRVCGLEVLDAEEPREAGGAEVSSAPTPSREVRTREGRPAHWIETRHLMERAREVIEAAQCGTERNG